MKIILKSLKTLLGAIGLFLLGFSILLIVVLLLFAFAFLDLCGTDIIKEVSSPDGLYNLTIYQTDCGATTGFTTRISIAPSHKGLLDKSGNIMTLDGHPDWTIKDIKWNNVDNITIEYNTESKVISRKNSTVTSLM
jgi:hypothetical protein